MGGADTRATSPRAVFQARGWLVLRGVATASDLIALNRAFDALIAGADTGRGVVQRPHASHAEPAVLAHLRDGVAAMVCDLLGVRSVRLLQDALLLKPPARSSGSIALHQDYRYTGYLDRPSGVAVGLAVSDAGVESGCLRVVDGSHAWGLVGGVDAFAPALEAALEARLTPAQRAHVAEATIPLEVRAGDVTIHHCLTLHGSGDNASARPRKTVIAHLVDGDSRVVPDRLPPGADAWFPVDEDGRLSRSAFPAYGARAS